MIGSIQELMHLRIIQLFFLIRNSQIFINLPKISMSIFDFSLKFRAGG